MSNTFSIFFSSVLLSLLFCCDCFAGLSPPTPYSLQQWSLKMWCETEQLHHHVCVCLLQSSSKEPVCLISPSHTHTARMPEELSWPLKGWEWDWGRKSEQKQRMGFFSLFFGWNTWKIFILCDCRAHNRLSTWDTVSSLAPNLLSTVSLTNSQVCKFSDISWWKSRLQIKEGLFHGPLISNFSKLYLFY